MQKNKSQIYIHETVKCKQTQTDNSLLQDLLQTLAKLKERALHSNQSPLPRVWMVCDDDDD